MTKQWDRNKKAKMNATRRERDAIKEIKEDTSLIVKKADKGGATVVKDQKAYIQEAQSQLADNSVYQLLSGDPTMEFKRQVDTILEEAFNDNVIQSSNLQKPIFFLLLLNS